MRALPLGLLKGRLIGSSILQRSFLKVFYISRENSRYGFGCVVLRNYWSFIGWRNNLGEEPGSWLDQALGRGFIDRGEGMWES